MKGDSLLSDTKKDENYGALFREKNPLGIEGVIHFGAGLMT